MCPSQSFASPLPGYGVIQVLLIGRGGKSGEIQRQVGGRAEGGNAEKPKRSWMPPKAQNERCWWRRKKKKMRRREDPEQKEWEEAKRRKQQKKSGRRCPG